MPDVKNSKNRIFRLSVCCLTHGNQFFGEIEGVHSRFQKSHIIEFDQNAAKFTPPRLFTFSSNVSFDCAQATMLTYAPFPSPNLRKFFTSGFG